MKLLIFWIWTFMTKKRTSDLNLIFRNTKGNESRSCTFWKVVDRVWRFTSDSINTESNGAMDRSETTSNENRNASGVTIGKITSHNRFSTTPRKKDHRKDPVVSHAWWENSHRAATKKQPGDIKYKALIKWVKKIVFCI